jgi:outer membrane receptor protein involved in Fe transport
MQFKTNLLLALVCAIISLPVVAQTQNTITGRILTESGEPLPGSVIQLDNSAIAAVSDGEGYFKFQNLPDGPYAISVSAMGMETVKKKFVVKGGKASGLQYSLKTNMLQMKTVSVVGTSVTEEINHQSYHVSAIDVKPLQNLNLDVNQVIGRSSGVRIREDGGLGSSFNLSLNGFSGKQVKIFMDGIPMENFGAALSLNNMPVNMIERVEIYKGVVPIWLGADALGGAINVVTNSKLQNFLDVSYSYGSFNTHRAAIIGGFTDKRTGFQVSLNVFKNHSDNNYWITTEIMDLTTKRLSEPKRVRRFHDQYRSQSVQLETGFVGKKFADRLLIGITLADNYKEMQTAAQMSRVYGGWFQESNTVMPSFKYQKKNLFIKNLSFNLYGSYNFGGTQNVDTVNREYNWEGNYNDFTINKQGEYMPGGENARSLYKFSNNAGLLNAGLNYALSKYHSFGVNYVFSTFNRKGEDVLRPQEESIKQPQGLQKAILAAGYKFDYGKRLSTTVFGKYYLLDVKATQRVDIYTNPHWEEVKNNLSTMGYGGGVSYFIIKDILLRASFEKTFRLPEGDEMFGDGINQIANKYIRPESSNNMNAGFSINHLHKEKHNFTVEANYVYRDAKDFIRVDVIDTRTQSVNIRDIYGTGAEGLVGYTYNTIYHIGANITVMKLINTTRFEPPDSKFESPLMGVEIPNIPFLYGNVSVGSRFKNVFMKESVLSINYYAFYVAEYYLKWKVLGNKADKNVIPSQLTHDIQLNYSFKKGKYSISLGCLNIMDAPLYDNFLMQKPGRSFNVKLRYFISSINNSNSVTN